MILYSDDKAATYRTGLSGWVSSRGFFFGDNKDSEHMARYDGCTHVECKYCGKPARRGYTACQSCRNKKALERYFEMPLVEYDGKSMIYSQGWDRFFADWDELTDHLFDQPEYPSDAEIQLILCEPIYLHSIDDDYWVDCYPTEADYELPDDVKDAIDQLNSVLAKAHPSSWEPGSKRLTVDTGVY
jgi:hypothetical protein